jgi:hypothetical protein
MLKLSNTEGAADPVPPKEGPLGSYVEHLAGADRDHLTTGITNHDRNKRRGRLPREDWAPEKWWWWCPSDPKQNVVGVRVEALMRSDERSPPAPRIECLRYHLSHPWPRRRHERGKGVERRRRQATPSILAIWITKWEEFVSSTLQGLGTYVPLQSLATVAHMIVHCWKRNTTKYVKQIM